MNSKPNLSESKRKLLERMLRGEAVRQSFEAPLEPREPGTPIPVAPAQQQIWLHSQIAPPAIYNEPVTVHFRGALDRQALERSFQEIIRRHEAWRTTFASADGQTVQVIHPELPVAIPFHDLSGMPREQRESELKRLAGADARRPFDLGMGPLLRARLFQLSSGDHRLNVVFHALIQDGTSLFSIFLPELAAVYEAFSQGNASPLPQPQYQYADFSVWQTRLLENDSVARQMEYWRQRLSGNLPTLQLPSNHPRPAMPSHQGGIERFMLSPDTSSALKNVSGAEGVTPYMFLLATFKAMLHRYSGQEDILVGGESGARPRKEFSGSIGYYLNTLVFRTRPQGATPFRDYLTEVKDAVLGAMANGDIPMDRLVREFQQRRDLSQSSLFQAMLVVDPKPVLGDARWMLTQSDVPTGLSKLDLYCGIEERAEGFAGRLIYNSDIFEASTVRRMADHWMRLLHGAIENPGATLAELPMLSAEERRLLVETWNATARPVPNTTIHQLFERQAARTPLAVAVEDDSRSLTYRQLNQESNRLARRLQELGAGPETLIGLCLDRSCDMLISVLAVLKSGAAYLPLDPALPEERFKFLLEDAGIGLLLTEPALAERLSESSVRLVYCDERASGGQDLDPSALPENLAYVLYTSGSTGRPKGVEIQHSAVVNFLLSMQRRPGFTAGDTTLALTTLSFDIAALEIFLPLITGGRVVIATQEDARDPVRLLEIVKTIKPTVVQGTPAMWRTLIEAGWKGLPGLKILCGGEAMARDLAQQLLPRCGELWNMYGPTETTVWSTIYRVTDGAGAVSIGRPIDNTQVYVLDAGRNLTPAGVTGELYIGGSGVARRYRHRPELTAERFIQQPALSPGRLYRTGDLARWRPDGTLECLGRADHQIKIRGFRIEPEEIEAAILDHPEVVAAAVKAWTDASQHQSLTAYITGAVSTAKVRTFLEGKLPQYMIPTRWVSLQALPLTPNGKVDRNRLPEPDPSAGQESYVAPTGETEQRLARIWETVLQRKSVGATDNFFDLGGHSLLVARLLRQVEFEFGARLSMASIFQAPTIAQFAQLLLHRNARSAPVAIPLQPRGSRTPLLWLYAGPVFRPLAAHLDNDRPFLGIAPDPGDCQALGSEFKLEALAECLARKIRTVQPEGPYNLGGWCAEGILAFEVATQLRRQGCQVDLLILLDSINPAFYRGMRRGRILASRLWFNLQRMVSVRSGELREFLRERLESLAYHFREYTQPSESFEAQLGKSVGAYSPEPYGGRVAAIMPSKYPSYREPAWHWADRVTGEFQIKRVSGNHVTMLEEPWVPDLAACITACLDEAEAAGKQQRTGEAPVKLAAG